MTYSNSGALLMGAAAATALALCIYNYVTPFTGIDGTGGALLVIASTTLLILFALALQMGHGGGTALHFFFWFRVCSTSPARRSPAGCSTAARWSR